MRSRCDIPISPFAFLALDRARLITGETHCIDGGYHIIDYASRRQNFSSTILYG